MAGVQAVRIGRAEGLLPSLCQAGRSLGLCIMKSTRTYLYSGENAALGRASGSKSWGRGKGKDQRLRKVLRIAVQRADGTSGKGEKAGDGLLCHIPQGGKRESSLLFQ